MNSRDKNWPQDETPKYGKEEDRSIDYTFISRCLFYICLAAVIIFFFRSCMIDKDTMEDCRKSCGKHGRVEKVTAYKCICVARYESIEDNKGSIWVLP